MIPEWEIEEAIASNPSILDLPSDLAPLTLIERQRYLGSLGRYIDILFRASGNYVIVELKNRRIDDEPTVFQQLLPYRAAFALESQIPEANIVCVLVSPEGFSPEIELVCKQNNVVTRKVDYNKIREAHVSSLEKSLLTILDTREEDIVLRVLVRRGIEISKIVNSEENVVEDVASAKTWSRLRTHDDRGLQQIATKFKAISAKAPIMAHEVRTGSNGQLLTNNQMWSWLFYSVLDRRTNAITIVKAKTALEKHDLFLPHKIVELAEREGKRIAIQRIRDILSRAGFALIKDSSNGDRAGPRSIVEAAYFIRNYDYEFAKWYNTVLKEHRGDGNEVFQAIWSDIQKKVYGVGPRIASQFVRGMVLKGPWRLPLTDDCLLEEAGYNVTFAGPHRFNLVEGPNTFRKSLSEFADRYLDGNRAIISHVLWYIRKSVCDKIPMCYECPMAGFCTYYLKSGYALTPYNQSTVRRAPTEDKRQITMTQFIQLDKSN